MATVVDTKASQDYLSQHFEQTNENKLKEAKSFTPEPQEDELVFTTTCMFLIRYHHICSGIALL